VGTCRWGPRRRLPQGSHAPPPRSHRHNTQRRRPSPPTTTRASAHGRLLVAQPDGPHRVGPCAAAGGRQAGPAALWRQLPCGDIVNPRTGKVRRDAPSC
jgi:hypothetical protein